MLFAFPPEWLFAFPPEWLFAFTGIPTIPALLILTILGSVFWGVLLGFFVGLGSSFSHKHDPSPSSSGTVPTQTSSPGADQAIAEYLPKIEVRNVEVSKTVLGENGVFGEVKNTGDRTLKAVEITVYCLDSDGKTLFEKQSHPVLVSDLRIGTSNQRLKAGATDHVDV